MKKRKIFTVVLIFSMLMATLTGCNKADKVSDTTKKPVIKIGSDNYPPYNFLNEDGIPTGIDVELATEAFPYTYREILTPEQIDYMMDWMYSPESLSRQMEEEGLSLIHI